LLAEIGTAGIPLEEAGRKVLEYIKGHVPEPRTVPLCGNSIGMDRRFLARYLPEIEEHLHYRSIDVSSVKELCRRWYREPFAARPEKADDHRALPDIAASIVELRYYRETIFK
jgi:oligoribonuclease